VKQPVDFASCLADHTGRIVTAGRDDVDLVQKAALHNGCHHGYRIDLQAIDPVQILMTGIQQFLKHRFALDIQTAFLLEPAACHYLDVHRVDEKDQQRRDDDPSGNGGGESIAAGARE
jgi:hypothetical protein